LCRRFHGKRLMWPAVVIKMDPITDYSAGVLQCFKPLPMDALLFQGSDHPFHHAVFAGGNAA
jgi:hypothetical protein